MLEDREIEIRAGDIVVQRGTMHNWRNPADLPARMIGFTWGVPDSPPLH